MVARRKRLSVGWAGSLSGVGIGLVAAAASLGLVAGIGSQIVLFNQYEATVEVELYGPLILPCLVALAAAMAGGGHVVGGVRQGTNVAVLHPSTPGRRRRRSAGGGGLLGPTERELKARWSEKLEGLHLPADFTPAPDDPALGSGRYEVSRHWATAQQPEQVCGAVQQALESWLGSASIDRAGDDGCNLSAVEGNDFVTTSFLLRRIEDPGPAILRVRISYAV